MHERKYLKTSETKQCICIYYHENPHHMGSCEISLLSEKENLWYFNRIKVRPEGMGMGTFLMKELIKILDSKNITLVCDVNPYGKLNRDQLVKFYKSFGFIQWEGSLIRYPKNY